MNRRKKAFVCGWPIEHSRSPIIHNYWLKQHRLDGTYVKKAILPEKLFSFLKNLEQGGFAGGNVTLPHKEMACKIVDQLDPVAAKLEAVNTVWLENGLLHGANTDGYGFLANLDQHAKGWDQPNPTTSGAIVLGAGGASRAIIHALQSRGYSDIRLVNRTISRAEQLARKFTPGVSAHSWQALPELMADAGIIVNTTSLGMAGNPPLEIDLARLPLGCLVTDIVYVPLETPLLQMAAQRGLRTVDGLGMLLHQAVPGFEKWFGVKPVVSDELRQLVISDMESGQ